MCVVLGEVLSQLQISVSFYVSRNTALGITDLSGAGQGQWIKAYNQCVARSNCSSTRYARYMYHLIGTYGLILCHFVSTPGRGIPKGPEHPFAP